MEDPKITQATDNKFFGIQSPGLVTNFSQEGELPQGLARVEMTRPPKVTQDFTSNLNQQYGFESSAFQQGATSSYQLENVPLNLGLDAQNLNLGSLEGNAQNFESSNFETAENFTKLGGVTSTVPEISTQIVSQVTPPTAAKSYRVSEQALQSIKTPDQVLQPYQVSSQADKPYQVSNQADKPYQVSTETLKSFEVSALNPTPYQVSSQTLQSYQVSTQADKPYQVSSEVLKPFIVSSQDLPAYQVDSKTLENIEVSNVDYYQQANSETTQLPLNNAPINTPPVLPQTPVIPAPSSQVTAPVIPPPKPTSKVISSETKPINPIPDSDFSVPENFNMNLPADNVFTQPFNVANVEDVNVANYDTNFIENVPLSTPIVNTSNYDYITDVSSITPPAVDIQPTSTYTESISVPNAVQELPVVNEPFNFGTDVLSQNVVQDFLVSNTQDFSKFALESKPFVPPPSSEIVLPPPANVVNKVDFIPTEAPIVTSPSTQVVSQKLPPPNVIDTTQFLVPTTNEIKLPPPPPIVTIPSPPVIPPPKTTVFQPPTTTVIPPPTVIPSVTTRVVPPPPPTTVIPPPTVVPSVTTRVVPPPPPTVIPSLKTRVVPPPTLVSTRPPLVPSVTNVVTTPNQIIPPNPALTRTIHVGPSVVSSPMNIPPVPAFKPPTLLTPSSPIVAPPRPAGSRILTIRPQGPLGQVRPMVTMRSPAPMVSRRAVGVVQPGVPVPQPSMVSMRPTLPLGVPKPMVTFRGSAPLISVRPQVPLGMPQVGVVPQAAAVAPAVPQVPLATQVPLVPPVAKAPIVSIRPPVPVTTQVPFVPQTARAPVVPMRPQVGIVPPAVPQVPLARTQRLLPPTMQRSVSMRSVRRPMIGVPPVQPVLGAVPPPSMVSTRLVPPPSMVSTRLVPPPSMVSTRLVPPPSMVSTRLVPPPSMVSTRLVPPPSMVSTRLVPPPSMVSTRLVPTPTMTSTRLVPPPSMVSTRVIPTGPASVLPTNTLVPPAVVSSFRPPPVPMAVARPNPTQLASIRRAYSTRRNPIGLTNPRYGMNTMRNNYPLTRYGMNTMRNNYPLARPYGYNNTTLLNNYGTVNPYNSRTFRALTPNLL